MTRKEHTICTYAVAVYEPPGNIRGFFEGNVTKGSFETNKYCKNPVDKSTKKVFMVTNSKRNLQKLNIKTKGKYTLLNIHYLKINYNYLHSATTIYALS